MSEIKNNIRHKEGIYFIKPFEIVSSYYSFMDTWEIANKAYKDNDEVADARLMQSFFDNAKYGYISYSNWKTKEAFLQSNLTNTVLKYHNALNGDHSNSAKHNLYNLLSEEIFIKRTRTKKTLEVVIVETDLSRDDKILEYWKIFCEGIKKNYEIISASFYKAIYKKSKFRYIGIINVSVSEENKNCIKDSKRNNREEKKKGFKVYTSLYRTVKKYS